MPVEGFQQNVWQTASSMLACSQARDSAWLRRPTELEPCQYHKPVRVHRLAEEMYVYVWSAMEWRLLRAVYNGREIDSEQNCHVHTERQLVATRGSSDRCFLQCGMLGAENTKSKSHRVYISVSLY
jgi:hypothetical protein